METLTDLSRLKLGERADLPERVRELTEAFERSVASDARAVEPLEALARGDDPTHAAWAALQLVTMGREQWADRLAELLPDEDLRFRLMAGHSLARLGREVPEGTLEGLTAGGGGAGELEIMTRDLVAVHPKVENYEIANVLAEAGFAGFPHDNLATQFYIYWVHTSPQWRRSGLSRLAFSAAMEHPEAQRCSCFALNTGTRNSAHALYRDFGYVDMDRRERAVKHLHLGTPSVPPEGIVIRRIGDEDRQPVRRFIRDYHADAFMLSPLPAPDFGAVTFTTLAERDGKLIGAAVAKYEGGESATLQEVAVAEGEDGRAAIGVALVARLHGILAAEGAKRVTAHVCSDPGLFTNAICRAGYSRETTGGVNMFGIRDLTQLLTEIRPLFERRLRETPFEDWRGRVILLGDRLRAGLQVEEASLRVLDVPEIRSTDVVLRTTDETITRFITGRETPLEGYLQRVTTIEPQVSPGVVKLLETLFPEVPFVIRWGW
jgi:ribosomal protein S18 acetylase RimI-like enzyme/N-acetylglutamate synthase-like GNAT family acetyltransferase